jgi:hypothetical protein
MKRSRRRNAVVQLGAYRSTYENRRDIFWIVLALFFCCLRVINRHEGVSRLESRAMHCINCLARDNLYVLIKKKKCER